MHSFDIVKQTRRIFSEYLENLTEEELYTIPEGFNNNVWWNIAHVAVTEQKLVYGLSGLPLNIDAEVVAKYAKGTFPSKEKPSLEEIALIKKALIELPEQTKKDLDAGKFGDFKPYVTTPKIALNTVEEAISFNAFHEGIHMGNIAFLLLAIRNK